jgi:hypothetical protein
MLCIGSNYPSDVGKLIATGNCWCTFFQEVYDSGTCTEVTRGYGGADLLSSVADLKRQHNYDDQSVLYIG